MKKIDFYFSCISCWLSLVLIIPLPLLANSKTIDIVSDSIDTLAEKDGEGLYWDIMRAVFEPEGYSLSITIAPFARAVVIVKNKNADALLNSRLGELEGIVYPEMHYSTAVVSVLCDQETFKGWQGEYSLAYKRVGSIRKYNYHDYLYIPLKLREVRTRQSGIKMVLAKRLDCFLDSKFELLKALEQETTKNREIGYTSIHQLKDIYSIKQYVGFSDTKKGIELAKIFDRRIKALLVSGELKPLFDKWEYRPFPFSN